jgi:hypothetical protein
MLTIPRCEKVYLVLQASVLCCSNFLNLQIYTHCVQVHNVRHLYKFCLCICKSRATHYDIYTAGIMFIRDDASQLFDYGFIDDFGIYDDEDFYQPF